jgi:hypothetical protein
LNTKHFPFLVLSVIFLSWFTASAAFSATIRVPQDQPTIQAGIDAAQDGDLVLVSPGTYTEGVTISGKTIILASEFYTIGDPGLIDQTVIDGPGLGGGSHQYGITVDSSVGPGTQIIGFTIQNADNGILVRGHVNILYNRITQTVDALGYIGGGGSARFNVLENNTNDGFDLDQGVDLVAENNIIRHNGGDGFEIRMHDYTGPTLDIIIRNNLVHANEDGIQIIAQFPTGTAVTDRFFLIERNTISYNALAGIGLMDNSETIEDFRAADVLEPFNVFNNTFVGNSHGISGGDNMVVVNNLFVDILDIALKRVDGNSTAAYNLFWKNGADNSESNIDSPTSLFADPLLDADQKLSDGSPAIDAGTAQFQWQGQMVLDIPPGDFSGGAPDLGRFEFEPGARAAAVNDPPVANNDSASTPEDTAVTIDVAANDSDPDGNLDPMTANSTCANGSTGCNGAANGSLSDNGDGTITYTPAPDFNGPDSFVYEICDILSACATATVSITVDPVNDPPVANNDSASTPEDTPVTIDVAANDTDPDGNLDRAMANTACAGCAGPSSGTLVNNVNGTFTFTPNPDYNGPDSFVYEICDTFSACATATVYIIVDPVNDPPVANNDSAIITEDTAVTIDVAANDSDPDGNLDPTTANSTCANGSTGCNGAANGSLSDNGDGTITYMPVPDFNGPDSFVYEICDTLGACATATVSITIDPVNDPPVANNDSASTPEDTGVTIDVAANDTDPEFNLDPATANTVCAGCANPSSGTLVIIGDGTFGYTPNPDFNGPDSFVYEICDTLGVCDTATVYIIVDPVNDPPVANNDSASTPEDTLVAIDVAANDSDPDGNLDPTTANSTCANGSAGCNGAANGSLSDIGDGTITYTPAPDFNGPDSFVYEICDTLGACATATVSITIDPVNDPPVANNDSASTPEDTGVTIDVAANDTDVEGNLNPASANTTCANGSTGCADPANGTLTSGVNCTAPGRFEQACLFDGVDGYISLASAISFNNDDDYTIAFWLNTDDISDWVGVLGPESSYDSFIILRYDEQLSFYDGYDGVSYNHFVAGVLSTNQWYHAVLTSNSGEMRWYLDGTHVATTTTYDESTSIS